MSQKMMASFYDINDDSTVSLKRVGTFEDINEYNIKLDNGLKLTLYDGELEVDGIVEWREEDDYWAIKIDPDEIRNVRSRR